MIRRLLYVLVSIILYPLTWVAFFLHVTIGNAICYVFRNKTFEEWQLYEKYDRFLEWVQKTMVG